jgi:hypothetical protein
MDVRRVDPGLIPRRRHRVLRITAACCLTLGIVLLLADAVTFAAGLYFLFASLATSPPQAGGQPAPIIGVDMTDLLSGPELLVLLPWAFGLFTGLSLVMAGGLTRLMIHVEENTRASAQTLNEIRSQLGAVNPGGGPAGAQGNGPSAGT